MPSATMLNDRIVNTQTEHKCSDAPQLAQQKTPKKTKMTEAYIDPQGEISAVVIENASTYIHVYICKHGKTKIEPTTTLFVRAVDAVGKVVTPRLVKYAHPITTGKLVVAARGRYMVQRGAKSSAVNEDEK